jgi:hypothetical protein
MENPDSFGLPQFPDGNISNPYISSASIAGDENI